RWLAAHAGPVRAHAACDGARSGWGVARRALSFRAAHAWYAAAEMAAFPWGRIRPSGIALAGDGTAARLCREGPHGVLDAALDHARDGAGKGEADGPPVGGFPGHALRAAP